MQPLHRQLKVIALYLSNYMVLSLAITNLILCFCMLYLLVKIDIYYILDAYGLGQGCLRLTIRG